MRSEGVIVLLTIIAFMVYFWWIMSPEELILDLELHKQHIKQKQVFILAGQSNMLGRGGVTKTTSYSGEQIKVWDGVVPPESHPNPAVFRLDGELRWELAREPLSHGIYCKITCGVGIGMAFANRLLEMDPNFGVVGLVPSAAGGTSITNWSGDSFNKPYKVLAKRAKFAVKSGGNLRAIFWYQGETDTRWSRNAKNYKIHLQKFIHKIRNDLGLPTLPFYQVIIPRLKKPFQGPYVEEVRKAQMETNATNLIKIEAEGLPIGADGVHLTTEGYIQLGHILADTFLKTNSKLLRNETVVSIYNSSDYKVASYSSYAGFYTLALRLMAKWLPRTSI